MFSALFVLSVLEAPNTKINSLCVCKLPCVCANTLRNKALNLILKMRDCGVQPINLSSNDYLVACKQSL